VAFWRGMGRMTLIVFWVAAVLVFILAMGLTILVYAPSLPPSTPDPPPTAIPGLPCCTTLPPPPSTGP
jgi:hypothetical protein